MRIKAGFKGSRIQGVEGKGFSLEPSNPTTLEPFLHSTYTGMAGRTMQRAVGLAVRGQAAVTGLERRVRVGVHRNRGGHIAGKLMAGAGVSPSILRITEDRSPASLPDLFFFIRPSSERAQRVNVLRTSVSP